MAATTSYRPSFVPGERPTAVRDQIRRVNPRVALVNPRSVASQLEQGTYAQPRFSLFVLLLFAGTGLGLLALGVYGVISYCGGWHRTTR
jgi:hypothetical protein